MFSGLVGLLFAALVLWCGVRIARRTGHSPWWSVVLIVPVANLVLVWVFAYRHWPTIDGPQSGGGPAMPPSYT